MRFELVEEPGSIVYKHSERLILCRPKNPARHEASLEEQLEASLRLIKNKKRATLRNPYPRSDKIHVPVLHLDHLLLGEHGITVSSDAIALCCERGVDLTIVNKRGIPIGKFFAPALHGTCRTRRAQISAYSKPSGQSFAISVVIGKLKNQMLNLKYFTKSRVQKKELVKCSKEASLRIQTICDSISALGVFKDMESCREAVMSMEAAAAREYWFVLSIIFGKETFPEREQRGTKNPVNAALNYAYGVLAAEIWRATILAGLEPYAGFLHADRPGRLSFVLDLMEEFRPIFDRIVFSLISKKWKIELDDHHWLTIDCKRRLLDTIAEKMDKKELYKDKQHSLRNIMQLQARSAAMHFLGKETYKPFVQGW
ncbi:MAG TPA: CRISPR-associated endonuclease Cas1 [Fimbriimonadales bacterium]|nr:CRISPR-associated endonuclease Cas1 [Fimbriimonadales bacterium]